MENVKPKRPPVFHVGILFLLLFLLTASVTSGLLARYTAKTTGSDIARVAVFEIEESLGEVVGYVPITVNPDGKFRPGDTLSYPVTIRNKSEVSVQYSVTAVREMGTLPLETNTISETLAPGATANVVLTVSWPSDKDSPEYMGKTEILRFTVTAEQVD